MSPRSAPYLLALIAALLASVFVLTQRLPLPFEGFAMLAAALLAGLGTLTLLAWAPIRWLWTDTDLIMAEFRRRHDITDLGAQNALTAITRAHAQASALRRAAGPMQPEMQTRVTGAADRLDQAARTLFYAPDRLRALQPVLSRAELIVEAAQSHHALRRAPDSPQQEPSRAALRTAIDALHAAFDAGDARAAQSLLEKVETASGIAENLLSGTRR
jgi:hypothetical protein